MTFRIRENARCLGIGFLVILLAGLGARWGTNVLAKDTVRDEHLMRVPIDDILHRGWSIETAIDYQEVKGPTFYWSYALACQLIGDSINHMRLVSVLFFIGSGVAVLLIASWCGMSGWRLPAVAALYVLLPYNLPQGQLLMSEPSFLFFAGLTMLAFVWGFGATPGEEKRLWGPVLFAIALSVLLHHRPHAIAFAGAAALVSLGRDGVRCWPWWLACFAAGVSRLPLWARWGGLVTSDYQGVFGLGVCSDCMTYLLMALLPVTFVFLWPALSQRELRRTWWWTAGGAIAGLALGIIALPDLEARLEFTIQSTGEVVDCAAFAGILATAVKSVGAEGVLRSLLIALLSGVGGAAVGAFAQVIAHERGSPTQSTVIRFAFWTLATGLPLYVITRGPIYDRYLLVWLPLMPIVWIATLPRWLVLVQSTVLLAIALFFVQQYLM